MKLIATIAVTLTALSPVLAEALDPAMQSKVDTRIKLAQSWAASPAIINAVKAHNNGLTGDLATMTQDKWKALTVLDPAVRGFTKNEAAEFMKGKKTDAISEAFVSGADGAKVAFLAKTSNWSHKGKAKHDAPMSGKTWQGSVEVDESTGLQQLQVAVPVLDGDKPIGSLVLGLSVSKLD